MHLEDLFSKPVSGLETPSQIGNTDGIIVIKRFAHPSPASPSLLRTFFQSYNPVYIPSIIPPSSGESLPALHDRCAYALSCIISNADIEDAASSGGHGKATSILICTHAAPMIAIGRTLTGYMPDDECVEDFKTYTYVCTSEQSPPRSVPLLSSENKFREHHTHRALSCDPSPSQRSNSDSGILKMWYLKICTQEVSPGWGARKIGDMGSGDGCAKNGLERWKRRGWGMGLCGQQCL